MPEIIPIDSIPTCAMILDVTRAEDAAFMLSHPNIAQWRTRSLGARVKNKFCVRRGDKLFLYSPGEVYATPKCSYEVMSDLSLRRLNPKPVSRKSARRIVGKENKIAHQRGGRKENRHV